MNVWILRGIPGSGKSTWATKRFKYFHICSADHFFMDGEIYNFDRAKLKDAHAQCLRQFTEDLIRGRQSDIVVDNTNIRVAEIAPYYALGEAFGHNVKIVWFHIDPTIAAARNVHNVPSEIVIQMAQSFDPLPPWYTVEHIYP